MTTISNNPFECGKKLKTGFDYFAKGFCKNELVDAHYRLIADRRQAQLLLECASFEEIDDFYNPGEYDDESDRLTTDMVLEAVRVRQFGQTAKTMAALQRVLNKHLAATGKLVNDEPMFAGEAIIGKPKKSGLFASVTVQFPINDGQTLSIIFHSPDNNKMKITAADEIIAFRWLLNKRDITSAVAPDSAEEGTLPGMTAAKDVSLEDVGIRCAQLIAKNSDRFQSQQKLVIEAKQALAEVKAQVEQLQGKNAELQDSLAAQQNDADKTDAQIKATQKQLDAQVNYNDELRAKLDALKATGSGNAGKADGTDTTGGVSKEEQDKADFEAKKAAFAGELTGRGMEPKGAAFVLDVSGQNLYAQMVYEEGAYQIGTRFYANAAVETPEQKIFSSKTLSGLDAQITKALAWIDKKLGEMKKVEPEKPQIDPTTPEGYATVLNDEKLQFAWQDRLDSFFQERIVNVRNALRELGWSTKQGESLLIKNDAWLAEAYKQVGAGRNVVGATYNVVTPEDTRLTIVDDLTQTHEELAKALDAAAVQTDATVTNPDAAGDTNPDRAEENAAVTILNDIIAGKYGMDRKAIDAALDKAAATLERLGMMELYDDRLNQAADELTRVLKEAAKGVA